MIRARYFVLIAALSSLPALSALTSSCSAFEDATPEHAAAPGLEGGSVDATSGDASAVDGDTAADAGGDARGSFCERNTNHDLCDDFQDETLGGGPWDQAPNVSIDISPSIVSIAGPAAGEIDPVLRIQVPQVDGEGSASLVRNIDKPQNPTIELAFTMQLTGLGSTSYVEIASVYGAAGGAPSAGIALDRDKLIVFADNGQTQLSAPLTITLPRAKHRLRAVLSDTAITVYDASNTVVGTQPLEGSFLQRTDLRFAIGLAYTLTCAPGRIDIDDVTLDY